MNSAVFSPDGLHRLRLDRTVDPLGYRVCAFFGVNPSKAGANINDPSVRKMIGFAARHGVSRFILANAHSLIATDVRELARAVATIHPDADKHIHQIIAEADILIPCWGARGKLPPALRQRLDDLMGMLEASGKPVMTFGCTASGDPKHPLMLGYSTPLMKWDPCIAHRAAA